jgi:hypothetical protein
MLALLLACLPTALPLASPCPAPATSLVPLTHMCCSLRKLGQTEQAQSVHHLLSHFSFCVCARSRSTSCSWPHAIHMGVTRRFVEPHEHSHISLSEKKGGRREGGRCAAGAHGNAAEITCSSKQCRASAMVLPRTARRVNVYHCAGMSRLF